MIYTYVLRSQKDGHWYTGWTTDLRHRFRQHQTRQVQSTRDRAPFALIYYEACSHEGDAMARERYLKSGMGKRCLRNRLKRFLAGSLLAVLFILSAALTGQAGSREHTPQTDVLTDGLVGYWTFDGADISGTTATDRSGQGNHGTLTNSVVRAQDEQALRFRNAEVAADLSGEKLVNLRVARNR